MAPKGKRRGSWTIALDVVLDKERREKQMWDV